MDVLYLCNGKRSCGGEFGCYLNGGECKHTTDESFAKTPKNERRFKVYYRIEGDFRERTLFELDSQDFLTV